MIRASTSWRSYLLGLTCILVNLAVIYTWLNPRAGSREAANFQFPEQLPISSGLDFVPEQGRLHRVELESATEEIMAAAQRYRSVSAKSEIHLQLSYLVGTRGDVAEYLTRYTDLDAQTIKGRKMKQMPEIGHHTLLQDQEKFYLSSCINPQGTSTVTSKQFAINRYRHDLGGASWWNWWRGQGSIRDRRCLWILLSHPRTQSDGLNDSQSLENAWEEIYRWWQPNFPPLTVNQDYQSLSNNWGQDYTRQVLN